MLAGIKNILAISTPRDLPLLGNGEEKSVWAVFVSFTKIKSFNIWKY